MLRVTVALLAYAAAQTALSRPPLPLGPQDRQVYVKINHQEYPVPAGLTPDAYYSQLTGVPQAQTYQTQTYQPGPVYRTPSSSATRAVQTAPAAASPLASYHIGFTAPSIARPAVRPTTPTTFAQPTYRAPPQLSYPTPATVWPGAHFGQRQWVKLAEGTQPIEVPFGADPQQFLAGVRASGRRYLRQLAGQDSGKKYKVKKVKKAPIVTTKKVSEPPVKKGIFERPALPSKKVPAFIPSKFHAPIPEPSFSKQSAAHIVPPTVMRGAISKKENFLNSRLF